MTLRRARRRTDRSGKVAAPPVSTAPLEPRDAVTGLPTLEALRRSWPAIGAAVTGAVFVVIEPGSTGDVDALIATIAAGMHTDSRAGDLGVRLAPNVLALVCADVSLADLEAIAARVQQVCEHGYRTHPVAQLRLAMGRLRPGSSVDDLIDIALSALQLSTRG